MSDFPTFNDLLAFFLITLSITAGIAVMIFVSMGVFALLEKLEHVIWVWRRLYKKKE